MFEKHKLLFSFILTIKILQGKNEIDANEWRYLLAGPSGEIHIRDNPTTWYPENSWPDFYRQIHGLNILPKFEGFEEYFFKNPDEFKEMFDS